MRTQDAETQIYCYALVGLGRFLNEENECTICAVASLPTVA